MSAPTRSRPSAAPTDGEPADLAAMTDEELTAHSKNLAAETTVVSDGAPAPEADAEAAPVDEAGSQSPADVAPEANSTAVEVRGPRGALGIDPHQQELSTAQKAALIAIGIDTAGDPLVIPHVRPFIHMCQIRDLDPYAREAYLIGRGKGANRKFTMQVAIDGYLKIAGATGRYIGIKKILWAGSDDDPSNFHMVDGVMEPIWWGKWPAKKGTPGAAKAIVSYYDEMGVEREMEAIADWEMYAPYNPKWVDDPTGKTYSDGKPKRIVAVNPQTGQQEMELTDMWSRGGPHMLAKCALALCLRRAFPARMSGMYLHEEMHQADAVERRRAAAEKAAERREYVENMRASRAPANGPIGEANSIEAVLAAPSVPDSPNIIDGEVVDDSADGVRAPERLGQILNKAMASGAPATGTPMAEPDPEPAPEGDEEQRREWLLAELDLMAEVVDATALALGKRWVLELRKNLDQFTAAELLPRVASLRPMVITKMREENGATARADSYAQVTEDQCGPVEWLLGVDLAAGK